jgi:hypothetical protein
MSKRGNKVIETKLGTSIQKNMIEITEKRFPNITMAPEVQKPILLSETKKTVKPVATSVPEVKLSPLRARLKERSEKTEIQERPHPLTQKKEESDKPKKKIVIDVKSPPKVFKSPTWYKSPRVKLIKPENVVLKQLLLKDHRYTETDVEKIVNDHCT